MRRELRMPISREDSEHIIRRVKVSLSGRPPCREKEIVSIVENILWPMTEGNLGNKPQLTVECVKGIIEKRLIQARANEQSRMDVCASLQLEELLKEIEGAENDNNNTSK